MVEKERRCKSYMHRSYLLLPHHPKQRQAQLSKSLILSTMCSSSIQIHVAT